MSATFSTILHSEGIKSPGTNPPIFNAHWARIARYFVRRAAVASLRELDDDALKDIGLARSEIEAAVYGLTSASSQATIR
ncbi:DUF1127 domain-containing protein [Rhizobium mongolense]|uniref:DUF1127 domain-containing protein n=1 Tax=Rhizobium mongolense TaxID=57676 RepID=UPI003558A9D7